MRFSVLFALLALVDGSRFVAKKNGTNSLPAPVTPKNASVPDLGNQVEQLRAKLQNLSVSLTKVIDPRGPLAKTELGPEMAEFNERVRSVVNSTAGKSDSSSLRQLQSVFASVRGLAQDLNKQQMRLMRENEDQQSSLLLGVLLTKKNETAEQQVVVLRSAQFAALPVAKEILAKRDLKTPLFQQVAEYLDAHGHAEAKRDPAAFVRASNPALTQVVASLQARLGRLEESAKHAEEVHAKVSKQLDEEEKTKPAQTARIVHLMRKKEDRKFAKMMAIERRDIQSMKDAIQAVQAGDAKGLERAKASIEASMKAMQSHNTGFLVLIQEGLRAAGLDCPYCAAQCVDKCHNDGKSYVACLKECQDAGK